MIDFQKKTKKTAVQAIPHLSRKTEINLFLRRTRRTPERNRCGHSGIFNRHTYRYLSWWVERGAYSFSKWYRVVSWTQNPGLDKSRGTCNRRNNSDSCRRLLGLPLGPLTKMYVQWLTIFRTPLCFFYPRLLTRQVRSDLRCVRYARPRFRINHAVFWLLG